MSSLVVGLLCIILILFVVYLIKRVNKLIDYVLGNDNSLLNLSVPDTSYTKLPEYIFVLSVFSKPIHDRIILGVYSSSDRAKERVDYYKKSFKHPENYVDYRVDTNVEDKENNGKYYSVLYVSWKDPKVPLTVFNKGED